MSLPYQEWRLEVGTPDHGGRLDLFLSRALRWRSREGLKRAIAEGGVRIRKHKDRRAAEIGRLRPGLKLRVGQEVVVRLATPRAEASGRDGPPVEIPVVYEDELVLALGKPPGLSVYPSRRHRERSLIERVHERHGGGDYPPTLCHRLDRETSGLVLFAKSRAARARLNEQFTSRSVEKIYLALVEGRVEGERGRIAQPIGPDPDSSVEIKRAVRPAPEGQPATTLWRLSERYATRTLLEVSPRSGRQHQLRVHLASIGHPIVGDKLYLGGDALFLRSLEGELTARDRAALGHDRQALHAWRLTIRHPGNGRPLALEAPLWPDLAELIAGCARDAAPRPESASTNPP